VARDTDGALHGIQWLSAAALFDQLEQAGEGTFEPRPQQRKMALAVEAAFKGGHHLVVEAGTGTGKTLAYLVPAVLSKRQVVVSTATKTLQDQLWRKDLPLLQQKSGLEIDAALLKGRQNYLCLLRYEWFEANPTFAAPEEAAHWPGLREWAKSTVSGDRAESQLPDDFSPWSRLSTTSDECRGQKCPLYQNCFVTKARAKAAAAKVVVVSHALFFADLSLRTRPASLELGLSVLPRYEAVVFDEAHALEEVATEHFGATVASGALGRLGNDAGAKIPGANPLLFALGLKLKDESRAFFDTLHRTLRLPEDGDLRLDDAARAQVVKAAVPLTRTLEALETSSRDDSAHHAFELDAISRRASELRLSLSMFDGDAHGEPWVFWVRRRGRGTMLKAAPVEVGDTLQRTLYQQVDSVVFTSATLSTAPLKSRDDAHAFEFVAQRFGLDGRSYDKLRVDSPFQYEKQAALYLPNLPPPSSPDWSAQAEDELRALIALTQGRAFVLFTSLAKMDSFHERLHGELSEHWQVLKQGERPRQALLDAFVAKPSVLFASQSFWEGVDVVGEALSLVVVDRLPFAPPDEPLNAARVEALQQQGRDAFDEHQLPQAALALRQGFGRLIRSTTDRGVMALLDSRVRTKAYGRFFLERLPAAKRCMDFDAIERWWNAG
jgi:ATP-dependent DNA helicase DinG